MLSQPSHLSDMISLRSITWGKEMWRSLAGAGALVEHENRVLMVLRHRSGKLRWELPSGLVESGESFEQTAERETKEETSAIVTIGSLLCTAVMDVPSEEYRGINAYYRATFVAMSDSLIDENEPIEKAAFVDICLIASRDIHPVDRKILARWRRLRNERPFSFRILL